MGKIRTMNERPAVLYAPAGLLLLPGDRQILDDRTKMPDIRGRSAAWTRGIAFSRNSEIARKRVDWLSKPRRQEGRADTLSYGSARDGRPSRAATSTRRQRARSARRSACS